MKLSHVGFRVADLDEAITLWEAMGFRVEKRFEKPDPTASAAWMVDESGGTMELWHFHDTAYHPKHDKIGKHVAFLCDDVRRDSHVLIEQGFKEVTPYTEGVVLNYIFLQDQFGLSFELAEEKKK